jgi:hypothetical protein
LLFSQCHCRVIFLFFFSLLLSWKMFILHLLIYLCLIFGMQKELLRYTSTVERCIGWSD